MTSFLSIALGIRCGILVSVEMLGLEVDVLELWL